MKVTIQDINEAAVVLNEVPDKSMWKTTTSRVFKLNLLQAVSNAEKTSWIELGAAQGHTTILLSKIAKSVFSIDIDPKNTQIIDSLHLANVSTSNIDLYGDSFANLMNTANFESALIDAVHQSDNVTQDIKNCLRAGVKTFVFDDYGAFEAVKHVVDKFVDVSKQSGALESTHFIGLPPGTSLPNTSFKVLKDWEGIIVKVNGDIKWD